MRIVLGFLSGLVGMFAGWFGLAFLVIALAGPDRDGGVAMGAFFNIGPLGALIGFGVGVWLFVKFGLVAQGKARRLRLRRPQSRRARRLLLLRSLRRQLEFPVPSRSSFWRSSAAWRGGRGTSSFD